MSYFQHSSPESDVSSASPSINPKANPKYGYFSQGGIMESHRTTHNMPDDLNSNVDYYFVKKLTLALEQLSLSREGRVEYGSPVSASSSTQSIATGTTVKNRNGSTSGGGGVRRLKVPLCKQQVLFYRAYWPRSHFIG